ncbi:MAG: hypothetical protein LBH04_10205 [Tannerellaceae bacterium]|nr:hypothetical protein [Tannerellaceae bacterium]
MIFSNMSESPANPPADYSNPPGDFPDMLVALPNMLAKFPDMSARLPDMLVKSPDMSARFPDMLAKSPDMSAKPPDMSGNSHNMSGKLAENRRKHPGTFVDNPNIKQNSTVTITNGKAELREAYFFSIIRPEGLRIRKKRLPLRAN